MSLFASMVTSDPLSQQGQGEMMQVDTPNETISLPPPPQPYTRSVARAANQSGTQDTAAAAEASASRAPGAAGPAGGDARLVTPGLDDGSVTSSTQGGTSREDAELGSRRPARDPADAPMRKLSISLIDTYKLINQARARAHPPGSKGRGAEARVPNRRRCRRQHASAVCIGGGQAVSS